MNSTIDKLNLFQTTHSLPRRLLYRSSKDQHPSRIANVEYAEHGVLQSITPVDDSSTILILVGVIAAQWPGWTISFLQPKFSLIWILIMDLNWIPIIQVAFPSCLILHIDQVDFNILPQTDIIAFNGPIQPIKTAPSFGCICMFDWNVRLRRWNDWSISTHFVEHAKCGGVSDLVATIKIGIFRRSGRSFCLPSSVTGSYPLSSLASILDHKIHGTEIPIPPRLSTLKCPEVTKVTHGCYHFRGHFPSQVSNPEFLIPCVFAKSRWVKRRLSVKELLGTYDVPIHIIQLLSTMHQRSLVRSQFTPIKCLSAVVQEIFLTNDIEFSGGG